MSEASSPHKNTPIIEIIEAEPALKQPPSPSSLKPKSHFVDNSMKSAFLTGTGLTGKKLSDERIKDEVYTTHDKLNGLVDTLDDKVRLLLNENQANFLTAYKEQMMHVQKELKTLKKKIDEETYKRKNDERMNILEQERDWFRNEALRLDQICKEQQRQLTELKFKTKMLNEDKTYYEEFALITKKENKALKEELTHIDADRKNDETLNHYLLGATGKNAGSHDNSHTVVSPRKSKEVPMQDRLHGDSVSGLDMRTDHNLHIQTSETEQKLSEIIRQMKAELDKEKKANRQLRNEKSQLLIHRMDLEQILVDSINEVKKDISRRKASSTHKDYNKMNTMPQNIDITKFSAADKRTIIEYFLSNDSVLEEVYNMVFGPAAGRNIITAADTSNLNNLTVQSTKNKYTFSYGFKNFNSINNMSHKELSTAGVSMKAKSIMGDLKRPDAKKFENSGRKEL